MKDVTSGPVRNGTIGSFGGFHRTTSFSKGQERDSDFGCAELSKQFLILLFEILFFLSFRPCTRVQGTLTESLFKQKRQANPKTKGSPSLASK